MRTLLRGDAARGRRQRDGWMMSCYLGAASVAVVVDETRLCAPRCRVQRQLALVAELARVLGGGILVRLGPDIATVVQDPDALGQIL